MIPFPVHPYRSSTTASRATTTTQTWTSSSRALAAKAWRLSKRFAGVRSRDQLIAEDRSDVGVLDAFRMPDHFFGRVMSGPRPGPDAAAVSAPLRPARRGRTRPGLPGPGHPPQPDPKPTGRRPTPSLRQPSGSSPPEPSPGAKRKARPSPSRARCEQQTVLAPAPAQVRASPIGRRVRPAGDSARLHFGRARGILPAAGQDLPPGSGRWYSDEKTRELMEYVFSRINEAYQCADPAGRLRQRGWRRGPADSKNAGAAWWRPRRPRSSSARNCGTRR